MHVATVHLRERSHTCKVCLKAFDQKSNRTTHVAIVHRGESQKPFQCEICRKTFARKVQLTTHVTTVHLR
jgi:uncharacterized Zn-finger protein